LSHHESVIVNLGQTRHRNGTDAAGVRYENRKRAAVRRESGGVEAMGDVEIMVTVGS
jgi:hypothetical protein